MGLSLAMGSSVWLEILNGPRFGEVEVILVEKYDGEVLGRSDGGLVGLSAKDFHLDHQTDPELGGLWNGWFGGLDERNIS